ncbi:MAG: hypothetical protein Q8763_02570 [Candidatus Phytoplasma australasiaticum]|nr:hypothetical protein [Candidatus Phytoplasma australasiaticum]
MKYSKTRNEKTMIQQLAKEIIDASSGSGAAVKKKEEVYRIAESNKSFAHYRW